MIEAVHRDIRIRQSVMIYYIELEIFPAEIQFSSNDLDINWCS